MRAFSYPASQLPISFEKDVELADRVVLMDGILFIFQLFEREQKVASKSGDLEKWVSGHVVKRVSSGSRTLATCSAPTRACRW